MLPPRIAALAVAAMVIAALTGLLVVSGSGHVDISSQQRRVADTATSRPAPAATTAAPSRTAASRTPAAPSRAAPPPTARPPARSIARPSPAKPSTSPSRTQPPAPRPSSPAPSTQTNRVLVPAQGVDAPVDRCRVVGGALLPPADLDRTCVWAGGAGLDARGGTTVLVGEAHWAGRGPAAFGRIGRLSPGALIVTDGRDGHRMRWRVVDTYRRPKADGLDPAAFTGRTGPRRLYLVSAGGRFDAALGDYLDNVYVQAVPAG